MGYATVAELSHELETLLDRVRTRRAARSMRDAHGPAVPRGGRAGARDRGGGGGVDARRGRWSLSSGGGGRARRVLRARRDERVVGDERVRSRDERSDAGGGRVDRPAPGAGLLVRVRLIAGHAAPGVRAFIIVQARGKLGDGRRRDRRRSSDLQADEFDERLRARGSRRDRRRTIERGRRAATRRRRRRGARRRRRRAPPRSRSPRRRTGARRERATVANGSTTRTAAAATGVAAAAQRAHRSSAASTR